MPNVGDKVTLFFFFSVSVFLSWLAPLIPVLGLLCLEGCPAMRLKSGSIVAFSQSVTHALSLPPQRVDGVPSSHTKGQGERQDGQPKDPSGSHLAYGILDSPPWYLCIFLGIQVRRPRQSTGSKAVLYQTTTDLTSQLPSLPHPPQLHELVRISADF